MDMSGTPISRRGALIAGAAGLAAASLGVSGQADAVVRRLANPKVNPAALSAQQQAGQRVIYSYSGTTVPTSLLDAISAGQAAGVIFFGGNISSDSQISSAIAQLVAANKESPVQSPLLLMTDQEGGQVRRLSGAPTQSEKQIGESSNPSTAASQAGTGAGQNLAGVGMNVNLAPVLGVYRAAGDFLDQYQRSYSMDASVVGECASAFISAQQATGVAATAKHFPGLGAATASEDTDSVPVTLNVSLSDLRSIDEAPYGPAISAGVKLVMASWAIYPALDATYPAGLSSTIIGGELRSRLGFKGVTMTDALEAGALGSFGSNGQRAVSAAQAGMDLILCSAQDPSQGQEVVTALADALTSGQLSQTTFSAAVSRVTSLRNGL